MRLFAPLKPRDVALIRQDEKCPVCGYGGKSTLRTVVLNTVDISSKAKPVPTVYCQHACAVCGARWYGEPIVKVSPNMVWRSIARNEIEKAEDQYWAQNAGGAYIEVAKPEGAK